MVFISLEGFLEAHPDSSKPPSHAAALDVPKPPVHVVITPGSPSKPTTAAPAPATTPKRSRLRRAASAITGGSSSSDRGAQRHPRNCTGSPTSASGPSGSPLGHQFVLYVSDRDVHHKWVLTKSASDFVALRRGLQATRPCRRFACCGPLRRILQSSRYKIPPPKRRRSDCALSTHVVHSASMQEYVNDLLQAVLTRETDCPATVRAWALVSAFLDVDVQRARLADSIVLATQACPEHPRRRSDSCTAPRPQRASTGAASVPSPVTPTSPSRGIIIERPETVVAIREDSVASTNPHDNCGHSECPICCSELVGDKLSQLLCGHTYHSECVRVWLRMQHTCPVCRIPINVPGA